MSPFTFLSIHFQLSICSATTTETLLELVWSRLKHEAWFKIIACTTPYYSRYIFCLLHVLSGNFREEKVGPLALVVLKGPPHKIEKQVSHQPRKKAKKMVQIMGLKPKEVQKIRPLRNHQKKVRKFV